MTGVVDWISARQAPLLSDVGRCRGALAIWPAGDAPDLFLAHYTRLTARRTDGLPYWDLLAGAITLQAGSLGVALHQSWGAPINADTLNQRAAAFVDAALARLP